MSKDRKNKQRRSKGERLNWESVSRDNGKVPPRDLMTGRFLTAVNTRNQDPQLPRNGGKYLVP